MDEKIIAMLEARLKTLNSRGEDVLKDEMHFRTVAYMLGDVLLPMCCMVCNIPKLEQLLAGTTLCRDNQNLRSQLARLIYDYLARCKGLG